MSTHYVPDSSDGKRSSDDNGGTAKKSKMALPGTGGENSSDPDTGNPSIENSVIPRTISTTGNLSLVFRKHHTLLSYGLGFLQDISVKTSETIKTTC